MGSYSVLCSAEGETYDQSNQLRLANAISTEEGKQMDILLQELSSPGKVQPEAFEAQTPTGVEEIQPA